jgi:hypothetical protein
MNDEPKVLICMPLSQAAMVARNSTTDQKCSECGQRVLIAPSGQNFLKANPDAAILCTACYVPDPEDIGQLAAPEAEILAEAATAQPNMWRNRN